MNACLFISISNHSPNMCKTQSIRKKWDIQIYIIQYMKAKNSPHLFLQIIGRELGMFSMTLLREDP